MSSYQLRYWNQLKEFRTHVLYLNEYTIISEKWDRAINIFLAITSSSSIAAWAIWQRYQIVWAVIIALSQILMAIKPLLPYKQRLKLLNELNDNMQEISLECEKGWFSVAEDELTEKQIHELNFNFRNKAMTAENHCLKHIVLPKKKKILENAEKEADLYLINNYHVGV
jgi:hypothetical protein